MGRIQKAYEAQFRALLQFARARRLDQGVCWLTTRAQGLSKTEGISLEMAMKRVKDDLAGRPYFSKIHDSPAPERFFCDAGLGGLARWLRAAGYEALWQPGIDDADLLVQAGKAAATILTTDSLLMERRLLRDGIIPALWLPPTLGIPQQLELVFQEFRLKTREPRCMSCGGELRIVDKEALRGRIPPRTYRWLDEYWLCTRCDKLFWRGTHWESIQSCLRKTQVLTSG